MKRKIIFSFFFLLSLGVIGYGAYWFFLKPVDSIRPIYLVPKDAIYMIETTEPIKNWETISNSEPWQHLQKNKYFAELTASANYLDTLVRENKRIFDMLGSRKVLISAHMYKRDDYDFLYVVDLEKVSQFGALQRYLESIIGDTYRITRRTYRDTEIIEMYDPKERETLYLSFIQNLLLVSYKHNLIEASIDQKDLPVIGRDFSFIDINQQLGEQDMFRFYFQYDFLDDYMQAYMDQPDAAVKALSNWLRFTGTSFSLADNILKLNGFTNLNDTVDSYLKTLLQTGNGKNEILEVCPQRTAFYMGLGFRSFSALFEGVEQTIAKDEASFSEYKENKDKLERFLEISIQEHFASWIDDEFAFIQTQPAGLGNNNEFAIVLKAKDAELAKENLRFVGRQIRRQTPVKFKEVIYRDYPIRFMSIRGFFKLFLGKMFTKLDKPYYTIIEEYVIFSNHPQTIKNFIDDFVEGKTLKKSKQFQAFESNFTEKSNATFYMNTPVMMENLKTFVDNETWNSMKKNEAFITCFTDIGFQLIEDGEQFKTQITVRYQDPNAVEAMLAQAKEIPTAGPELQVTLDDIVVSAIEAFRGISPDSLDLEELISVDEIIIDDLDARKQREYYEDGETLKIEVSLKDGLKHGRYKEYYENGNIKVKGRYKNDEPAGTWKFYDENGKRIRKERY